MNKENNVYIIIYASVMVIIVALLLAFTSQFLQEKQKKNENIDKMRQILRSINVVVSDKDAEEKYKELITDAFVIDNNGNKVDGNAFETDLVNELSKPKSERKYPVYVASVDGAKKYILSMRGAGLWGPIWGYVSLNDDKNTVYGADFGHAGETPGLGAEIDKPVFSHEFIGKKFYNAEGKFVSIAIVKPGKTAAGQDYVDGISGGTITSQGVNTMLETSIGAYDKFLKMK